MRFAASRDGGQTIRYVPGADNAREPWFELGLNRCGAAQSAPDSYRGGWCDPSSPAQMARTDPHTTTNYMVGGLMESPTGEEVLMYVASPGAMGHGEIFTVPPVEPVTKVLIVAPPLVPKNRDLRCGLHPAPEGAGLGWVQNTPRAGKKKVFTAHVIDD